MTAFRELSQHILDIFENSATAGAGLVRLVIREDFEADRLSIVIEDDGHGMDAQMLARLSDPWVTTRTTRNVGLGIPFFKQAAEMCGGSFEIQSQVNHGTVIRADFQHSHIDRPPLGDLIATLGCMIVGYPDVAIAYSHTVDDREFSFDTRKIREVLGDAVPLSDPEVLAFLHGMLEEGECDLRGKSS